MGGVTWDLGGETAIVTGGSRGIGFAIGRALAAAGAHVVVVSRSQDAGAAASREMASQGGGSAEFVGADVGRRESVEQMVLTVAARRGRVDLLVNAAGANVRRPAVEMTQADLDLVVDVNLKGVFHCCRAVAGVMAEAGGGRIVNIGSLAGTYAFLNRAPYAAAKAGVAQLTRVFALEWARLGIRVNAVAPGLVRTPLTEAYMESDVERYTKVLGKIPLGRFGDPEDVVGAVLFLASGAAGYVTGQTLTVDGGYGLGCLDW